MLLMFEHFEDFPNLSGVQTQTFHGILSSFKFARNTELPAELLSFRLRHASVSNQKRPGPRGVHAAGRAAPLR